MSELAIVLAVAAIGYGVSRWLRLSVIPLLMFGGLALNMTGWLTEARFREDAFVLSLGFLVFSAGMELNPTRFVKHLKAVLWVGILQFVGVGAVGFGVAHLLGFSGVTAVYLALALSTSSTLVVVNQLKQQQQLFEPFARLVIGVLLVQDLLIILIIVLLTRWNLGAWALTESLVGALALTGVAFGCQRWLVPYLVVARKLDEETLLLIVLALLFAFVGLARTLGVPPIAGAFLAGFALAKFPANGVARGLLLSLTDFFQAIFFTTLGTLILLPTVGMMFQGLAFAVTVLLLTPPLVAFLAEWQGATARPALESGLLLAQVSEFALVLGLAGSQVLGQISTDVFAMIALVVVFTMTLTPLLATDRFTTFLLRFHPLRHRLKAEGLHQNHVLILGFGAGGMWVLKPLLKEGYDVVVIDDDPAVIEQLQKLKIPCIRGDGADEKVLDRAGAKQARLILASMRRVAEATRVLQHVPKVPVVVRVFENAEAELVRKLGGIPILNSLAAANTFMEWFDKTLRAKPEPAGTGEQA